MSDSNIISCFFFPFRFFDSHCPNANANANTNTKLDNDIALNSFNFPSVRASFALAFDTLAEGIQNHG